MVPAPAALPLPERQLDLSNDARWLGTLASDIAAARSDAGTLSFRLSPKQLGRIEVSIEPGARGLLIQVAAETEAARSLLSSASQRLVTELGHAGVRVDQASISTLAGDASGGQSHRDQRSARPQNDFTAHQPPLHSGDDRPLFPGRTSRFA